MDWHDRTLWMPHLPEKLVAKYSNLLTATHVPGPIETKQLCIFPLYQYKTHEYNEIYVPLTVSEWSVQEHIIFSFC